MEEIRRQAIRVLNHEINHLEQINSSFLSAAKSQSFQMHFFFLKKRIAYNKVAAWAIRLFKLTRQNMTISCSPQVSTADLTKKKV